MLSKTIQIAPTYLLAKTITSLLRMVSIQFLRDGQDPFVVICWGDASSLPIISHKPASNNRGPSASIIGRRIRMSRWVYIRSQFVGIAGGISAANCSWLISIIFNNVYWLSARLFLILLVPIAVALAGSDLLLVVVPARRVTEAVVDNIRGLTILWPPLMGEKCCCSPVVAVIGG